MSNRYIHIIILIKHSVGNISWAAAACPQSRPPHWLPSICLTACPAANLAAPPFATLSMHQVLSARPSARPAACTGVGRGPITYL